MGHIKDMYKLVRWVDNDIKGHDATTPEVAKRGNKYRLSAAGIRDNYSRESGKGHAKVRDLIESCIEEGYFKTEGPKDSLWLFINPKEGKRLLRTFGPIPSGFVKEVLNDDKNLVWTITTIIIAVCTIINVIIATHPHK